MIGDLLLTVRKGGILIKHLHYVHFDTLFKSHYSNCLDS